MKRMCKPILALILILIACPSVCYSAWIWTPETGKWINPKHAVKDTAEEQHKWAMRFFEGKDYKRAVSEFDKLVKFYPNSKYASNAQYYMGRCYEDMEEYYHAYLAYQKAIEAYPYIKNRDEIIGREYNIGLAFYNGQKATILGLAVLPATDKAVEIFEQVVKNSPYGDYADKSQFYIGEAYKKSSRFAEATLAFQKLVEEYPKSDLAKEANYEIAQCAYLASLGASYDQEPTDLAIEKFRDIAEGFEGSTLSKEAKEALKKLEEKKAKSIHETASFYERIGRKDSAVIYYKEIVNKYPESALAKESLARVMEIEKNRKSAK